MNIHKKRGNTIKSPFGVPTRQDPAHHRVPTTVPRPAPQPFSGNEAVNAFATAFTPIMNKLPVRALPDYKPFANAGIEMARTAVEDSGITKYCSFDPFKIYFNINNLYVLRKLLLIIAPYTDLVLFSNQIVELDAAEFGGVGRLPSGTLRQVRARPLHSPHVAHHPRAPRRLHAGRRQPVQSHCSRPPAIHLRDDLDI